MTRSRLPRSLPESLKFKKREISNLNKALVHERKAEKLKKNDESLPYLEFLERWKSIERSVEEIRKKATKELNYKLAKDPKPHELLGHLMASLPKPRLDLLFKDERIKTLNLLINKRQPDALIKHNEGLMEIGIDHRTYINGRRDLKFSLGLQAYKASNAIALLLTIVRYACDPKIKKQKSLVKDDEVLAAANGILREIVTHLMEHLQIQKDVFFDVGDRRTRTGGGIKQPMRPNLKV